MKPEDKSAIQSLISDLGALRSRTPEEPKFKDWKDKTEKKLEELFGRGSEQSGHFRALRFFDFGHRGSYAKEAPLREEERAQYLRGLDEARRLLQRFLDM
jgi:hypothetical protein